jgi:hypothetical protein
LRFGFRLLRQASSLRLSCHALRFGLGAATRFGFGGLTSGFGFCPGQA